LNARVLIINFRHVSNAVGGGRVDRWTDGQRDRMTEGQTDGLTTGNVSAVAASKKRTQP